MIAVSCAFEISRKESFAWSRNDNSLFTMQLMFDQFLFTLLIPEELVEFLLSLLPKCKVCLVLLLLTY